IIAAHPVGSGKTLSGIGKFEKLKSEGKANKALVVVPAGLRHNFANEGVSKFTDSKPNIIGNQQEVRKGTGYKVNPDSDYNVVSYEMFRKNPEKILEDSGADTIILDEMHRLKNQGTSTIDSFKRIKGKYNNTIGLTGSVISNKISDVYNLIDLASGGDHALGKNQKDFEKMYLERSKAKKYRDLRDERKPVVGFKNRNTLKEQLGKYIDYASADEVRSIAKIPVKDKKTVNVPVSKQQARLYKAIINENPNVKKLIYNKRLETLKDDEMAKAFSDLIEARKLMNSVGSVIPGMSLEESSKITPKASKILSDAENHLKNTKDGQVILLSNLVNGGVDVLEAGLKEKGIPYGKFVGKGNKGVTEEARQQSVKDYNDRKLRAMIISGAGAEGLSLGDTTWEGTFDPHYNPERINQMEARGIRSFGLSHRPEEDRKVQVNRYVATMPKKMGVFKDKVKTPDEVIYEIANNKSKQNQLLYDLLLEDRRK
ncbi:MAG: SNF2-related protein, partial [Paraclostridium sp.]